MIGQTFATYKIEEIIYSGEHDKVYRAKDTLLNRTVVLKILDTAKLKSVSASQLIDEARTASSLDHPNICTIYHIDKTDDGQLFICMPFYDGQTLKEVILSETLQIEDKLSISIQIAAAMSKAHEHNIIHRDIKPDNIFLTKEGLVKILDFGLARAIPGKVLNSESGIMGTLSYMAPEVIKGKNINKSSDIWAFGITLYELFTGQVPFTGDYDDEIIYQILNEPIPLNLLDKNKTPKVFTEIIRKCLEYDPEKRIKSFNEIIYLLNENTDIHTANIPAINLPIHKYAWYLLKHHPLILYLTPIIILIFLTFFYIATRPAIDLKQDELIFVSNFINNTPETILDNSVSEAVRVSLRQSAHVNILPYFHTRETLIRMGLTPDQPLDLSTSIAIARREGCRAVISGEVNQVGQKFILTSKITDSFSGETVKLHHAEVSSIENILKGIDDLVKRIRNDLGESFKQISKTNMPLEKVTTTSIEALEYYSRGTIAEATGDYANAIILKEKAIEYDSLFLMAISDLSYYYRKIGNNAKAIAYHEKIPELINRVTERERLMILTIFYGPSFEGDYNSAYKNAKKWVTLYPMDPIGHATLAHLSMFYGDYHEAIKENHAALKIDSALAPTCYNNCGYTYALMNAPDSAFKYLKKSQQLRPYYFATDHYMGRVFFMTQQYDSALSRYMKSLAHTDTKIKLRAYTNIITHHYCLGEVQRAKSKIEEALRICQQSEEINEAAFFYFLQGELEKETGDIENYLHSMHKAIAISVSPFTEYVLAAISLAKSGFHEETNSIINKLKLTVSSDPYFNNRKSACISLISGFLHLNQRSLTEAQHQFAQVDKFSSADPFYLMAQKGLAISYAQDNHPAAIDHYLRLLDLKGEIHMAHLSSVKETGFWLSELWPETLFELGVLYKQKEDTTNALVYLNQSLTYWKNADRDYQLPRMAHNYLKELVSKQ